MAKLKIGDYNTLTVLKVALREGNGDPFGLYLDGGRAGEILMPQKYVPEGVSVGDELRVFVYLDQEETPHCHNRAATCRSRRVCILGVFVGKRVWCIPSLGRNERPVLSVPRAEETYADRRIVYCARTS